MAARLRPPFFLIKKEAFPVKNRYLETGKIVKTHSIAG